LSANLLILKKKSLVFIGRYRKRQVSFPPPPLPFVFYSFTSLSLSTDETLLLMFFIITISIVFHVFHPSVFQNKQKILILLGVIQKSEY
jgi:hypothetical protein